MKLHDNIQPGPSDGHDEIWELIPWYVNGSLPEDLASTVRDHAQKHPVCAREIERQRALAEKVVKTDPFDVPLDRSWATLRAQVESDIRARTPRKTRGGWLAGLGGRGVAVFSAVATACIALIVSLSLTLTSPSDDFVTLTSGAEAHAIKFQSLGGLTSDALSEILEPHGVLAVTGPTDTGVFTAILAKDANLQGVADAMMALPEILHAAPVTGQ